MIFIYCKSITNRIQYACEIIFKTILLVEYKITTSQEEFNNYTGPKITYGNNINLATDIQIEAVSILYETSISKQNSEAIEFNKYKALFATKGGTFPFDPFANAFFLVSRYEEYLPSVLDSHKRFKPENSVAFQRNFLKNPIVNLMAIDIKKLILEKHPNFFFKPIPYNFVPTLDIDNAFAYKNKGVLRNTLAIISLLFKLKFKKIYHRSRVLLGLLPDPYDSYEKQMNIHDQYGVKAKYFFLLGDYNSFDKNVNHRNKELISVIKQMNSKYDVGIHPSYYANYYESRVKKEINRLENIIEKPVEISRQHYLRIKFPETYQNLIKCGIKHDYSMGYSTQLGFRASICTPFPFYDISSETITNLIIHPFVAMDASFKFFLKVRASEVPYQVKPYYEIIKNLGGEMCVIFHNESIGAHKNWKNWINTYEGIIRMCLK